MTLDASPIHVRPLSFDVERGAGGLWNPRQPELSHTLNAFQLALPYLEPYFIDAIRQALPMVTDDKLRADALAFCQQEANHARQHKRYSRVLHKRYPKLAEFETRIKQDLIDSRRRDPLEWRLAYTAGYELITAQTARMLFEQAPNWFNGADPQFEELFLWHAAEEIEHRHVAFDVLSCVTRDYTLRVQGLGAALVQTYKDVIPVVRYMLEVDGYLGRFSSKWRGWQLRYTLLRECGPAMLRYCGPNYHPLHDPEPRAYVDWLRDHAHASETVATG